MELAVLLTLMAIVLVVSLTFLGQRTSSSVGRVGDSFEQASGGAHGRGGNPGGGNNGNDKGVGNSGGDAQPPGGGAGGGVQPPVEGPGG